MALHLDDGDEFGSKAPRPLDTGSIERGSFDRLGEGQGAVSAGKGGTQTGGQRNASQSTQPLSRRALVLLVVAAVLVIAVSVALFIRILNSPATPSDKGVQSMQTEVTIDGSVSYRGVSYALVERPGGYALAELKEGNQFVSLGDVAGTPVALVPYDDALLIPENLSGGKWDVMAYTIGSGWSVIMDKDGKAQSGEGAISEVRLDGSVLHLVVDGSAVDVPLAW